MTPYEARRRAEAAYARRALIAYAPTFMTWRPWWLVLTQWDR